MRTCQHHILKLRHEQNPCLLPARQSNLADSERLLPGQDSDTVPATVIIYGRTIYGIVLREQGQFAEHILSLATAGDAVQFLQRHKIGLGKLDCCHYIGKIHLSAVGGGIPDIIRQHRLLLGNIGRDLSPGHQSACTSAQQCKEKDKSPVGKNIHKHRFLQTKIARNIHNKTVRACFWGGTRGNWGKIKKIPLIC